MHVITPRWSIVLLGAVLAATRLAAGPWEPLFNGRDLTGWREVNGTAPYAAVDGMIVSTTVPGSPNSFLATEKTYGDFIFECEVKQDIGPSNSGVIFRGLSTPDHMNGRVHGYQLEIESGVRVEDIKDPVMREIRYLDKLVDELAKGKAMGKILRET